MGLKGDLAHSTLGTVWQKINVQHDYYSSAEALAELAKLRITKADLQRDGNSMPSQCQPPALLLHVLESPLCNRGLCRGQRGAGFILTTALGHR